MTLKTFDSEVPPLKIRCSLIVGSTNNSFNVQQTQKSFSTMVRPLLAAEAACCDGPLRSVNDDSPIAGLVCDYPANTATRVDRITCVPWNHVEVELRHCLTSHDTVIYTEIESTRFAFVLSQQKLLRPGYPLHEPRLFGVSEV
jgi:hypothetical protein